MQFFVFLQDNRLDYGIVGAQTKGQFHMIYGTEGTQALFTGLATQIVYGGCAYGQETASYKAWALRGAVVVVGCVRIQTAVEG